MVTMMISELENLLEGYRKKYGDIPVALWEPDTSGYYTLAPCNIEAQRMGDNSVRLSIGVNGFCDPHEEQPAERPLGA